MRLWSYSRILSHCKVCCFERERGKTGRGADIYTSVPVCVTSHLCTQKLTIGEYVRKFPLFLHLQMCFCLQQITDGPLSSVKGKNNKHVNITETQE